MKYIQWILLALCGFLMQGQAQAQGWERLRSLGSAAGSLTGLKVPGLGGTPRSNANSASDPIFGKARIEVRGEVAETTDYWPWKVAEGYIARDKTGCPAFHVKGEARFVYSVERFEENIDGKWVELPMKKIATEVPPHCTGGGG